MKNILSVAESQILTSLISNYCERLKEAEKGAYKGLQRERRELTIEKVERVRKRVADIHKNLQFNLSLCTEMKIEIASVLINFSKTRQHQDGELLKEKGLRSCMKPALPETTEVQKKWQQHGDQGLDEIFTDNGRIVGRYSVRT